MFGDMINLPLGTVHGKEKCYVRSVLTTHSEQYRSLKIYTMQSEVIKYMYRQVLPWHTLMSGGVVL